MPLQVNDSGCLYVVTALLVAHTFAGASEGADEHPNLSGGLNQPPRLV